MSFLLCRQFQGLKSLAANICRFLGFFLFLFVFLWPTPRTLWVRFWRRVSFRCRHLVKLRQYFRKKKDAGKICIASWQWCKNIPTFDKQVEKRWLTSLSDGHDESTEIANLAKDSSIIFGKKKTRPKMEEEKASFWLGSRPCANAI